MVLLVRPCSSKVSCLFLSLFRPRVLDADHLQAEAGVVAELKAQFGLGSLTLYVQTSGFWPDKSRSWSTPALAVAPWPISRSPTTTISRASASRAAGTRWTQSAWTAPCGSATATGAGRGDPDRRRRRGPGGRGGLHHLRGFGRGGRRRLVEVEGVAPGHVERHGHDEALVAVGLHRDAGAERLARLVGHGRHRNRHGGDAAVELGAADFQPRLIAGAVGVDRLFLLRLDFDDVAQRLAGVAGQGDRLDADLDLRGRRQAQRLEELLHGGQAGRGRPLHRVGPAVGLVPRGHLAALEQGRRLLGVGLGLLGHLPRALGAAEHAGRERLDRHLGPDDHRGRAAVGLDRQVGLERLVAGPQPVADDVHRQRQIVAELEVLSVAPGASPKRQPEAVGAGDGAVQQPHALVFQVQVELPALVADGGGRRG